MKAPIIVLEGLDACGKSTQTKFLQDHLKKKGFRVGFVRFPGYDVSPAGRRIAAYLRGEFGKMNTLDPKLVANLYATDRLYQIEDIEKLRTENDIVIFDRGVTSNLIYTPARGEEKKEIQELEDFIEKLEYEVFGFPKESLVIFLDAGSEARKKIHAAKNRLADLHEADEQYLEKVHNVALNRCKKDFRWVRISVDRAGDLRRREDIAHEILTLVLEKLQKAK
jgi:dTMP kinase